MKVEKAIAFFEDMKECTYGNLEEVEMAIKALENQKSIIAELEKIKAEIKELKSDSDYYEWYGIRRTINLIDKHISELKGED